MAGVASWVVGDGAPARQPRTSRVVTSDHVLLAPSNRRAIETAVSRHLGRTWVHRSFTDVKDRASHPAAILGGDGFAVFAKLGTEVDAAHAFRAELNGLAVLRQRAAVLTPTPIGDGLLETREGTVLLFEAVAERPGHTRTRADWEAIGHLLARLHQVREKTFGLDELDGYFGPLRQVNHPVSSNRWADYYAIRRVLPYLRLAVDNGRLPLDVAIEIERLVERLPALCGPEPAPALLHGDAQQNNFLSTDAGAVAIDAAPYFGHPEIDLALIDYFEPVPTDVFDAYREIMPIDAGFERRRELWRIFAYLAVVTVDGHNPFGRRVLGRLREAVRSYL